MSLNTTNLSSLFSVIIGLKLPVFKNIVSILILDSVYGLGKIIAEDYF